MNDGIRIYLCGTHSSGKTTLARWTADTYGIPLISEVARAVLAEMETDLVSLRTNLKFVRDYQQKIFKRQVAAEEKAGPTFVADRSGLDNLAYAACHSISLADIIREENVWEYAKRLQAQNAIVFFVRPHRDLLKEDGVRAIGSWEEINKIDGMVTLLLEMNNIDYISIDTSSMATRARSVRAALNAAGVKPLNTK